MQKRSVRPLAALCLLLGGCTSMKSGTVAVGAAGDDASSPAAARPSKLADRHFGEFSPFASPIDDYLAVGRRAKPGKFNASITELMPFGNRLFFGYGDADYNLGEKTPIEMRALTSADEPTVEALVVDAEGQGASQKTPRQSGEEQIDRYRVIDGELWQAGIDSIDPDELWTQDHTTPKGIQGNVYRLDGDVFKKHRSINGGEHVHDLAAFKGALYSVGSGADTRTEFEGGQVFRYLWRSADKGTTFETVKRVQNTDPGNSDTRWTDLLATSQKLFMFGYESSFSTNSGKIINAVFDGQAVSDLVEGDPLKSIFPSGTLPLPDGTGLIWGRDVATVSPAAHNLAWHVAADGAITALAAFAGSTVLDVSMTDTGEIVSMVMAGDDPDAVPTHWDVKLLVADAAKPDVVAELTHFSTDVRPVSIAFFKGALFLGTGDGKILRATEL